MNSSKQYLDGLGRPSGVGASEAAALIGKHPYLTLRELAARKIFRKPQDPPGLPLRWGNALEPSIGRRAVQMFGGRLPLTTGVKTWDRVRPVALCIPDFLHLGDQYACLVQTKVRNEHAQGWTEDTMPEWYRIQCVYEIGVMESVTGRRFENHLTAVSLPSAVMDLDPDLFATHWQRDALVNGLPLSTYTVLPDQEQYGQLVDAAEKFWTDYIDKRLLPSATDRDDLAPELALLPKETGPGKKPTPLPAPPTAEPFADAYLVAKRCKAVAEADMARARNDLAMALAGMKSVRSTAWRAHWLLPSEKRATSWKAAFDAFRQAVRTEAMVRGDRTLIEFIDAFAAQVREVHTTVTTSEGSLVITDLMTDLATGKGEDRGDYRTADGSDADPF